MKKPVDPETAKLLRSNPHYKPTPGQLPPEEVENVRTFGVVPSQVPLIDKHPTSPRTFTHKSKKLDDEKSE